MLVPIILAGGSGSRLWPASRELFPKPFLALHDGESLLQKTFRRACALDSVLEILTATNEDLFALVRSNHRATDRLGVPRTSFMLEPVARNTAPAIAAAAIWMMQRHGETAQLLFMPADHLIEPLEQFVAALERARPAVEKGRIVTFGVTPNYPNIGYGYIHIGAANANANTGGDVRDVLNFVEKPTADVALSYVESGDFLWNAGLFYGTAGAFRDAFARHAPEIWTLAEHSILTGSISELPVGPVCRPALASFAAMENVSIDYAVMERERGLGVIECGFCWDDIGSWNAVSKVSPSDVNGNHLPDNVIAFNTKNCFVQSQSRVIGTVGLDNIVVVDTEDALLVAHKDAVQDVRQIVAHLKLIGHETHRSHATVRRPWGSYSVLLDAPGFKVKRLDVDPGAVLSLQMHHHRHEHWVVVQGQAEVQNGEAISSLNPNESVFIPLGNKHRLRNIGAGPLSVIEVQCGAYLGEDDIVRFEDVYNRVAPAQQTAASHATDAEPVAC